jgi:hypothetical protein
VVWICLLFPLFMLRMLIKCCFDAMCCHLKWERDGESWKIVIKFANWESEWIKVKWFQIFVSVFAFIGSKSLIFNFWMYKFYTKNMFLPPSWIWAPFWIFLLGNNVLILLYLKVYKNKQKILPKIILKII